MSKLRHYIDMEARYRKQTDIEPASREKHLASAEAGRRLSDTAILFSAATTRRDNIALATIGLDRGQGASRTA